MPKRSELAASVDMLILCTLTVAVGDCGVLRPDVRHVFPEFRHAFPEYRVATDRPSDNIIIRTLKLCSYEVLVKLYVSLGLKITLNSTYV